jgi:hypothetical protein
MPSLLAPQLLSDSSSPHVFHAAGGATFAASVVAYITRNYSPPEWPQIYVFLPNRRSVTTLRDAFLDALENKTALLPVMIPLADIDPERLLLMQGIRSEAPSTPIMHPARRLMLIARQVEAFLRARGENCSVRVALEMAGSLAQLLDEAVRYGAVFAISCPRHSARTGNTPPSFWRLWENIGHESLHHSGCALCSRRRRIPYRA